MRTIIRVDLPIAPLFVAITFVCGCGGNATNCTLGTEVTVNPTSATVNHAAAPPANQVQFIGTGGYAVITPGERCEVPALAWIAYGTWSNPDPTEIKISSADNSTNGTAVCLAPTNGAVTLKGTFSTSVNPPQSVTQSVQLTCE